MVVGLFSSFNVLFDLLVKMLHDLLHGLFSTSGMMRASR